MSIFEWPQWTPVCSHELNRHFYVTLTRVDGIIHRICWHRGSNEIMVHVKVSSMHNDDWIKLFTVHRAHNVNVQTIQERFLAYLAEGVL